MDRLRQFWIEGDFRPTEDQLRSHLPGVMEELGLTPATGEGRGEGGSGEGER